MSYVLEDQSIRFELRFYAFLPEFWSYT